MKQSSAIFLILLLIAASHQKETTKKASNQIKEKSFPILLQKAFNQASESSTVKNSDNPEPIHNDENKTILSNDSIKPISNRNLSHNNQIPYENISLITKTQTSIKSKENDDQDYSQQQNINCSQNNCFYPYGSCINATTCQCNREYASFKTDQDKTHFYCSYERKKQLVSFLLEFFFPFGVGHFYAGRILIGVLKMIICFSQCVFAGLGICFAQDSGMVLLILLLVIGILYISWELIDIILIALNVYKDGFGVPLANW